MKDVYIKRILKKRNGEDFWIKDDKKKVKRVYK